QTRPASSCHHRKEFTIQRAALAPDWCLRRTALPQSRSRPLQHIRDSPNYQQPSADRSQGCHRTHVWQAALRQLCLRSPICNDGGGSALVAKGLGEIGITGVAAAIANAVYHATGKRIHKLPIRLDEVFSQLENI